MTDPQPDSRGPTLAHLLAQVSRLVGGRMRARMEGLGLRRAQALALFQLWHEDGMAQNVLARALHISPATATSTLQGMERDGWIARGRDPVDQRIVRVHLTPKARTLQAEVQGSLEALDEELTAGLSGEEQRLLRESLLKVRSRLAPEPLP
ncbi:MAG TPA: MarR family transcriptional regulator [Deferrisomatales bacterium]|nr:MarR family transcriptional regulator [Deferrisomatales bacterium]